METTELSLIATFDELRRCADVLTDGTAEIEYRKFLQIQEESRSQWQETKAEAQRLQMELDKCSKERADLETKLFHARRLLELEAKSRRAVETEHEALERKLSQVCDFLKEDRYINDETRHKYAFLNLSSRKRKSKSMGHGNDINSTGSFLSDLSVTQSEEDFLDDEKKQFKRHRPSTTGVNVSTCRSTRRSLAAAGRQSRKSGVAMEVDPNDKIVATTKVTIPQDDGPIEATSTIEAVPNSELYNNHFEKVEAVQVHQENGGYGNAEIRKKRQAPATPLRRSMKLKEEYAPSAPPLHEVNSNSNTNFFLNLQGRQHDFSNRTVLRNESCGHCSKRLRFGASGLKCRMCSVFVHPDCKVHLTMACVPKSQGTPNLKNGKQGFLSEYAPSVNPMVPGIIVHCINEVEQRGLSETGIYRVSGSDKEVKGLKDRFLKGKTVPSLGQIDIHVICGCIKDFLRNLKEPIIPSNLWAKFANACQLLDDAQAVKDLLSAINELPQANRDTLAFLILHLKRVAASPDTKMPIDNLAKVFGPTILGYSSVEIEQQAMYNETIIQTNVMLNLLNIPTNYWTRYIYVDSTTASSDTDQGQKVSSTSYFGTPISRPGNATLRKRFFETPPTQTSKR